jgi:hypothetical protein
MGQGHPRSRGANTKAGKERCRQAGWKNGAYTKEALELRKETTALIRQSKNPLSHF